MPRAGRWVQASARTTTEPYLEALVVLSSLVCRASALLLFCLAPSISCSQEATSPASSDQQATVPRVAGVFVYPVPNAPFSGTVEIVFKQKLADGSVYVLKTINYIARDSHGRTRNENRKLVSSSYEQEPPITSVQIYDPVSSLDSRLDPDTLIAKQTMHAPPVPNAKSVPAPNANAPGSPVKQEDLGTRAFQQMILHGTRQSRSPNDVDEFWYSPDLSIFISRKHQDPIWEQTINVTELDRAEPDPSKFIVPTNYKIVKVAENQYTEPMPGPDGVYSVRGEVLPPRFLSGTDPKFSPQAPKVFQGAAVVSLVVDAQGNPQNVKIKQSVGFGLDEEAVAAVKKYKFAPATLHGKPVPVYVDIRVDFKRY
jgi:TonB family protein